MVIRAAGHASLKTKRASARNRPRRSVPDDACIRCGTIMVERRARLSIPINGEKVMVPSSPHLACPKCGEVVLRLEEAKRLRDDAIAIYRKKHRLLSGREIRAIRERFGLTQGELARLLHLGANTLSRWESGRNVQSESMEVLLRLIRDLPGSLEHLQRQAT
jgi:putative zinc finger/helix-turn-helix YgiT family protein